MVHRLTAGSLRNLLVNDAGYPSEPTVRRWIDGSEPVSDDVMPIIERVFGFEVRAKVVAESAILRASRPGVRGPVKSKHFEKTRATIVRLLRRRGEDYAADAVERLAL